MTLPEVGDVPGSGGLLLKGGLPSTQFYSWCCVLNNFSSLIPRPLSAFRASQCVLRSPGIPSPGGGCHHTSQKYPRPLVWSACG